MPAAAGEGDRERSRAAVSGPLLGALVLTATLGLVMYLTPPHLRSLGPEEIRFWVTTRVVWVTTALAVVAFTAVRLRRRGR